MPTLDAVRARFVRNEGLPFADILTEASIRDVLNVDGVPFRGRVFSPKRLSLDLGSRSTGFQQPGLAFMFLSIPARRAGTTELDAAFLCGCERYLGSLADLLGFVCGNRCRNVDGELVGMSDEPIVLAPEQLRETTRRSGELKENPSIAIDEDELWRRVDG